LNDEEIDVIVAVKVTEGNILTEIAGYHLAGIGEGAAAVVEQDSVEAVDIGDNGVDVIIAIQIGQRNPDGVDTAQALAAVGELTIAVVEVDAVWAVVADEEVEAVIAVEIGRCYCLTDGIAKRLVGIVKGVSPNLPSADGVVSHKDHEQYHHYQA
jgi:hypothetical protein